MVLTLPSVGVQNMLDIQAGGFTLHLEDNAGNMMNLASCAIMLEYVGQHLDVRYRISVVRHTYHDGMAMQTQEVPKYIDDVTFLRSVDKVA